MRPFLLLLLAACVAAFTPARAAAEGANVRGVVRSAGAPVAGATVRILELDQSARSGASGEYVFTSVPPGTWTLYTSLVGYAAVTQRITVERAAINADVELKASALPLKTVVVSAAPTARLSDDAYQSTESKGLLDVQTSGGASWAERLSDLPGVTVRLNGSAAARPLIRGLGDNEVLVLENGLRMGDIATYDPAHATPIAAASVSQMDVVRGPAAILYGSGTIGGLVNMITNIVPVASDHAMSGTVTTEYNTGNDGIATYLNNVFTRDGQAFRISGGLVNSANVRIPSNSYVDEGSGIGFALDRLPQTFQRSAEVGAGWSLTGDWGTVGIGGRHYEMDYGIPGVPATANWLLAPPTTSRIKQDRNTIEMRAVYRPTDGFAKQWSLDAAFNDYNHSELPTEQDSTGVSSPQAVHFMKRTFNASLRLQHQSIGDLHGTVGLWTNMEDLAIDGDDPLGPNSFTLGFAGYAFEELAAGANTRLQAGLRFDYNSVHTRGDPASTNPAFRVNDQSRLSNAFTASLGAIQQLAPGLRATVSVARSFRAPTVQELFANGPDAASNSYTAGNTALDPEIGMGIEASLKGDFEHVSFELTPYLNTLDHYIYAYLRGDTLQGLPVRAFAQANAQFLGAEAAVTVQPLDHFAIRASADAVRAMDTDRSVYLPFIPPIRGLVRATWQDSRWTAMAEWRGAADQQRLGDGDTFTGGYGLFNASIGVRLVQGAMVHNLSLRADNIFNRDYRDHLSVIKDFLPMPGFALRLNYQVVY